MAAEAIDALTLESHVIDEFVKRGFKVTNVEIHPDGDDGAWRIGEGTRPAFIPYDKLAREIEGELRKLYRLKS